MQNDNRRATTDGQVTTGSRPWPYVWKLLSEANQVSTAPVWPGKESRALAQPECLFHLRASMKWPARVGKGPSFCK